MIVIILMVSVLFFLLATSDDNVFPVPTSIASTVPIPLLAVSPPSSVRRCNGDDECLTVDALQASSHSQGGEDMTLVNYFFKDFVNGTFLELGALDGVKYSNSHMFETRLKWHGVLIEANPSVIGRLRRARPNARVIHSAVCSHAQTVQYCFNTGAPAVDGIREFMAPNFVAQWHKASKCMPVDCQPLSTLLPVSITHLDFFSLDVEGGEAEVLASFPFDRISLSVVFAEADGRNRTKDAIVRKILTDNGGTYVGWRGASDFFVFKPWFDLGVPLPTSGFISNYQYLCEHRTWSEPCIPSRSI